MKSIRDIDFSGKRVIVRVDFNVPMEGRAIISDTRISAALPTVLHIMKTAEQVVLMSHLGRPDGQKKPEFSMQPVRDRLEQLLGQKVYFAEDCLQELPDSDVARIVLLENLRFYVGEEANDEAFAKKLAEHADFYVNDAFGTMHRAHASTAAIAKFIPGAIGFLAEKELKFLNPDRLPKPVVAIIGGSKISTKFGLFQVLLEKVDYVLVGGAMVFTFLKTEGLEVGKSLFEPDQLVKAKMMMNNEKLILPTDIVVADDKDSPKDIQTVFSEKISAGYMGLDLGKDSVEHFRQYINRAKSIVWNGPLGMFEKPPFDTSTNEIARILAQKTREGVVTVLGGADTESAVQRLGLENSYTHLSTGGGASLELLSGKELPAVKALKENEIEFFT